jgi:hypothetical protein
MTVGWLYEDVATADRQRDVAEVVGCLAAYSDSLESRTMPFPLTDHHNDDPRHPVKD